MKTPATATATDLTKRGPESNADAALWRAGNRGRRPRVYYTHEGFVALREIREKARAKRFAIEGEPEPPPPPAEGEEPPPDESVWTGAVDAVAKELDSLQAAIENNPDYVDPDAPPPPAEGEDAAPFETPSDVLMNLRGDYERAIEEALLPEGRADLLAVAASESLANALSGVDDAAAAAMAAHGPPPEEEEKEGGDAEADHGGDAAQAPPAGTPPRKPPWKPRYLRQLRESVSAMLCDAVETFEEIAIGRAEAEVNKESLRRVREMRETRANDTVTARGGSGPHAELSVSEAIGLSPGNNGKGALEWDVYDALRRRKMLLGREPSGTMSALASPVAASPSPAKSARSGDSASGSGAGTPRSGRE